MIRLMKSSVVFVAKIRISLWFALFKSVFCDFIGKDISFLIVFMNKKKGCFILHCCTRVEWLKNQAPVKSAEFFGDCVLLWKEEMDEKLAERGGWVRFCHFFCLFFLKIRLYLSVGFLIALADFLILSADAIRMLADSLIASAREWLRLCGRREKNVDWSRWWKAKNRKFLYGCIELRGCF